MTMIGAWHGIGGGQQGFPSEEWELWLIWFELTRWKPKATQVGAHLWVHEHHTEKQHAGLIGSLMFYIWMETYFHRASNDTDFAFKLPLSKRESLKQVEV
jgi:hypothetical protein